MTTVSAETNIKTLVRIAKRLALGNLLDWAYKRYDAEVVGRPDVNVNKQTLQITWNQVIRKLQEELGKLDEGGSTSEQEKK